MAKTNRFFFISALVLAGTAQFCGTDTTDTPPEVIPPGTPDHTFPEPKACMPGKTICVSDLTSLPLNLGQTGVLTGSLTASTGFSGTVNLTAVRTDLDTVASAQDVTITFTPPSVTLDDKGPVTFSVSVKIATSAPPITGKTFTVHAAEMGGTNATADSTPIPVTNKAQLTIDMFNSGIPNSGATAHLWKLDGTLLPLGSQSPDILISATKWPGGIQVSFMNDDPNSQDGQIIHSGQGAKAPSIIPHGDVTKPLPTLTAYNPAKITGAGSSNVYCHAHGPSSAFLKIVSQ